MKNRCRPSGSVHLPERGLRLQVEILRRAAAQDHAAVLVPGEDDGADLVDVLARVDHQAAVVHELVVGDVHPDGAVAGRRRVDGHAVLGGSGKHRVVLAAFAPRQQVLSEPHVQLGGRDGLVDSAAHEEVAHVRVGLEQHRGGKENVVDPDHALVVQIPIVEKWRSAVQGEIQRVVEVVIEICACADDEVHQPSLHQLDQAAAEPGRRQRAGHGDADGGVVVGVQHLLGEDVARLGQPRPVERLEAIVDERADVLAAARAVVLDGLAGEVMALAAV